MSTGIHLFDQKKDDDKHKDQDGNVKDQELNYKVHLVNVIQILEVYLLFLLRYLI